MAFNYPSQKTTRIYLLERISWPENTKTVLILYGDHPHGSAECLVRIAK